MLLTVRKAETVPIRTDVTPTEHRKRVYRRQINLNLRIRVSIPEPVNSTLLGPSRLCLNLSFPSHHQDPLRREVPVFHFEEYVCLFPLFY